jgi:hypothetical protein
MDRRALFFLSAATLCALLIPAAPSKFRWFAIVFAVAYTVLAVASWLDNRTRNRSTPGGDQPNRPVM